MRPPARAAGAWAVPRGRGATRRNPGRTPSIAGQRADLHDVRRTGSAAVFAGARAIEADAPLQIAGSAAEAEQLVGETLDRLGARALAAAGFEHRVDARPHPVAILRPHPPAD